MRAFIGLLCLLSCLAPRGVAQGEADARDELGKQLEAITSARVGSIVTVRLVLELKFSQGKQEIRNDVLGVVVDAGGLIMAENDAINPSPRDNPMVGQITITPLDVKIVIGNEEKEHDAFIAAKDTKLGLAFLQIKKPEGLELKPLVLDEKRTPAIGEQLVVVGRRSKGYDFAPFASLLRVSGRISKPRKATGTMGMAIVGLPVFDLADRCVGVHVPIASGVSGPGGEAESQVFLIAPGIVAATVKLAQRRAQETLAQIAAGKDVPISGEAEAETEEAPSEDAPAEAPEEDAIETDDPTKEPAEVR